MRHQLTHKREKPSTTECREALKQGLREQGFSESEIADILREGGMGSGDSMQALIQRMNRLEQEVGRGSGGEYQYGNRDRYVTGGRVPSDSGHGGEIRFDTAEIPGDSLEGDTVEVGPADNEERARLAGEKICSVYLLTNDTVLDDDKGNIVVNLFKNGSLQDDLRNVPIWRITPTADDEIQRHHVGDVVVSIQDEIQVQFEVISNLVAADAEVGGITPWIESGQYCPKHNAPKAHCECG